MKNLKHQWKTLDEELPEIRKKDYQILCLIPNGEYKLVWIIKYTIPLIDVLLFFNVKKWKYII